MAEQRQPFRFRLPWLAAPPTQPAQPQSQPAPTRPAQRPPFRPAGVAPAQPPPSAQPPARAEPQPRPTSQPPSQPQISAPSRAPPASSTRPVPQTQVTSQTAAPVWRASTQPQPPPQTAPQSRSPSRVATPPARPKISAGPTPTPSQAARKLQPEAKPPSPKEPQSTVETSQPQKQPTKQETFKPPSQEPQRLAVRTPRPEKVVSPENQKKQPDYQGPKPMVSGPKPELYQTSSEEGTKMLGGKNHEENTEKKVTDTKIPGFKAQPKGHPLAVPDERGQHPDEEVFDGKEVLQTFRTGGRHAEADINGQEKVIKSPHKPEIAGEKAPLPKEMKEGGDRFAHKLGAGRDKQSLQEKPFSIITLSGENTGATMHLSSDSESSKRERSIHIHRGYKINPDESVDTATDGEGSLGGRKPGGSKLQEESAKRVYVNNNAQGVNNSLVFNSSVTERNPGVHVALSRKPLEPGQPANRKMVETRKSEVATTAAERLTYAPTIRRRCLRGLFLDSSESDPENPEKPRHHGCRVGCGQKSKDNKIDVL